MEEILKPCRSFPGRHRCPTSKGLFSPMPRARWGAGLGMWQMFLQKALSSSAEICVFLLSFLEGRPPKDLCLTHLQPGWEAT